MELNVSKGTWGWLKKHLSSRFFGITNNLKGAIWHAMRIGLLMNLTIASNSQAHTSRKGIYH